MKKITVISLILSLICIITIFVLGNNPEDLSSSVFTEETVTVSVSSSTINPFLGLVNGEYAINGDLYECVPVYGVISALYDNMELNPVALSALKDMFHDAEGRGYELCLASGWRSHERQTEIYDSAEDKSYVQKPGHSEHQTGLAADLACLNESYEDFGDGDGGKWVRENAHKYGLILRYPEDKTDITGISYESWHFRYVGTPHAAYIYENRLCLEEYMDFLQESGGYDYTFDGVAYRVIYSSAENNSIEVPANAVYDISDDNINGFVITAYNDN